ncbi:hypothetical protein D3C78_1242440 [compost metagenome]
MLGGLEVILLLQQHVTLDPVHLRPQRLVAGMPVEQILALGAGAAPLPEGHGRRQGAAQGRQRQQLVQAAAQLLGGEGHSQAQGEIEIGGGIMAGIIVMVQQQQHATRREQPQVVGLLQQADPLAGLVVILAAEDGIERLLAQQGWQGGELFAVVQLGGGHPLVTQPLGEGRAQHGIVFDQEDLHLRRSFAGRGGEVGFKSGLHCRPGTVTGSIPHLGQW